MNSAPVTRQGIRNAVAPNIRQYIKNAITKATGGPMNTKVASIQNLSQQPAAPAAPKPVQSPTATDTGIPAQTPPANAVAGNRPGPMTKVAAMSDFFKNVEMSKAVENYLKSVTRKPGAVLKGPAGPGQFVIIRGQRIPLKTHTNVTGKLGPEGKGQFVMKTASVSNSKKLNILLKVFNAGKKVGEVGKKHPHILEAMAGGATAGGVSATSALLINNMLNKKRDK